jgi:Pvc16 N-terminal domain
VSNSLALATVTAGLRLLLEDASVGFPGLSVTAKHPDRARVGESGNQLNVFLYHLGPDAAWRNAELPKDRTGAAGFHPPIALTLEYLLTAFASDDDELQAQGLLGRAMSILHDSPVLDRNLLANALPGTDLQQQPDRVRITPATLTIDDVSKLWTSFQSNYRLSVPYTASVVLIDSTIGRSAPLPVLSRGESDRGVLSKVGVGPRVDRAYPDVGRPGTIVSARLGNDVVIEGAEFSSDLVARFQHPLTGTIDLVPRPGGISTRLVVQLPDPTATPAAMGAWAPGWLTLSVVRPQQAGDSPPSNTIAVPLAPSITVTPTAAAAGDFQLTVACSPQLRDSQVAILLFGETQVPTDAVTTNAGTNDPSSLTFTIHSSSPGTYVVRLRVDGVDSLPITMTAPGEPLPTEFDDTQQVTVS